MTAAPAPPRARPLPGRGGGDGEVLKAIRPRGGPASEWDGARSATAPGSFRPRRPPACLCLRRPGRGGGRSPECRLPSPVGASCWPCPVPPHPCAMAGWGSWGWDLLPVTNHIARDFQPTLSPASGATAVTASAEDTDPGMGMGWQRGLHRLRLAWGAGLSCL
ncbi:uncharacterized protein LOC116751702 [Phocoena sinus]|uniref:uncharacterized protein LOC116751702 n=1 Tax=Phocoena sinus TaxID=42100 RepID=UPI0013C508F9|nr:uncharacterized protein LOC116751702 [Phocoena sinus]